MFEEIKMDEKTKLYPTKTCFDDAIDFLNLLYKKQPWYVEKMNKQWRVVHGRADDGEFSHCWLTKGNSCFDFKLFKSEKIMVEYTREEFEKIYRPRKQIPYTVRDCCHLEKRVYGYAGPWDPEIRNLCPDVNKALDVIRNLQYNSAHD